MKSDWRIAKEVELVLCDERNFKPFTFEIGQFRVESDGNLITVTPLTTTVDMIVNKIKENMK